MAAPLSMTLSQAAGSRARLSLSGEIDLGNAGALAGRLQALAATGRRRVVVDMSRVGFCDCAGLAALDSGLAWIRAYDPQGWLRLVGPQPVVRKILRITGFDRSVPVYDSAATAVAA